MTMNNVIINLLLRKPFYGYILSSLKIEKSMDVGEMEMITGPVVRLIYNPEWLELQEKDLAFGAILHELLHLILLHPIRRSGRLKEIWAIACDMAVNEQIEAKMLSDDAITVGRINREFRIPLEKKRGAEYYYKNLIELDTDESLKLSGRKEDVLIHFPDGDDKLVKLQNETDLSEINSKAVQSAMEEIIHQAADEGEIPGQLRGAITGIYKTVEVNWRNVLKKYLAGKGRMQNRKTVKKISRRFDDMPGNRRTKGIEALAAIDESGSISDEDILTFYNELRLLKRMTKADIRITRFDTDCTKPVPLERYLKTRTRVKKGGTDFRPVFSLADKMAARLVLIFTDGEGISPADAKQRVLWILTKENRNTLPFGDKVKFTR